MMGINPIKPFRFRSVLLLKLDDVRSNLFLCKVSLFCGKRLSCCCNNSTIRVFPFGLHCHGIPPKSRLLELIRGKLFVFLPSSVVSSDWTVGYTQYGRVWFFKATQKHVLLWSGIACLNNQAEAKFIHSRGRACHPSGISRRTNLGLL